MKAAKQLSPLLTLFETARGAYSLRLSEVSQRATFLSIEVAKLLTDAITLQVITPTDMKVFDLTGGVEKPQTVQSKVEEMPEPEVMGAMPQPMDMEEVIEISQAEEQKINGEEKRFRQPKPRIGAVAGFDEACQRCSGSGTVEMLMEGGHAATGVCPVCQGQKVIRRFGARR